MDETTERWILVDVLQPEFRPRVRSRILVPTWEEPMSHEFRIQELERRVAALEEGLDMSVPDPERSSTTTPTPQTEIERLQRIEERAHQARRTHMLDGRWNPERVEALWRWVLEGDRWDEAPSRRNP